MWDQSETDPTERQHHVDFRPSLYAIKKEILELVADEDPKAKEALNALEEAHSAVDFGCGAGNSTTALADMCNKLTSVDMVDGKPVISTYIVDELTQKGIEVSTHQSTQIHDYLEKAEPDSKDLIFFGNVLNHNLSPEDIQKMSILLHEEGLVFETDQTHLDLDEMRKYFDQLYRKSGVSSLTDIIWRKKSATK